jgi:hypothetical protein
MHFANPWLPQGYRFVGYDECSIEELIKFINDRGIGDRRLQASDIFDFRIKKMRIYQRFLVQKLMKADDERMFTKLFELPPEIRNVIYSYYVADFGKDASSSRDLQALRTPTQPPLAKVSRTLRHEVLPIFYNQCRFRISFNQTKSAERRLCIQRDSSLFLANISKENFDVIRKMEFAFQAESANKSFIFCIDLTSPKRVVEAAGTTTRDKPGQIPAAVKRALDVFVAGIHDRDGKLRLEDVYFVRKLVEWTWKREK